MRIFKQILFLIIPLFLGCGKSTDLKVAKAALQAGDWNRAERFLNRVLDKDPLNKEARYGLVLALYSIARDNEVGGMKQIEDWKKSLHEFQICFRQDSSADLRRMYGIALYQLARFHLENGEVDQTITLLDKSVQIDSLNDYSINLKALIYSQTKKEKQAEELWEYLMAKNPKFLSAYLNLGEMQWREKKWEDAWITWKAGLEVFPKNASLLKWSRIAEEHLVAGMLEKKP